MHKGGWLWWTATRTIGRRASLNWLGAQFAIAALFAPWLAWVLPLLTGFTSTFWQPTGLLELLVRALTAFSIGRVDSRLMPAMVEPTIGYLGTAFCLMVFALGARVTWRSTEGDQKERVALVVCLLTPLLAYFVFTQVRFPVFDERYVLFLTPPFLLLLARGVVVLQKRTWGAWLAAIAVVLIVLASAHSLFNYWYVPAHQHAL